jgi:predicted nucleic acid-binding protein
MSSLVVVLDANVLFPASLRDTLLRTAKEGLYRLQCTEEIIEEVHRNLVRKGVITEHQAQRLKENIRYYFAESFITHHRPLIDSMPINTKDRHVLAAAIAGRADIIVTNNLKDFPPNILTPFEIRAKSSDEFLVEMFSLSPETMVSIVRKQAKALHSPPKTVFEILSSLTLHAPTFVDLVQKSMNL